MGEHLVNRRLAYVAVSRGRYDAEIYTNDRSRLGEALSRDVSHRSAIEPTASSSLRHGVGPASAPAKAVEVAMARGTERAIESRQGRGCLGRCEMRRSTGTAPVGRKWSRLVFAFDRLFPKRGRPRTQRPSVS